MRTTYRIWAFPSKFANQFLSYAKTFRCAAIRIFASSYFRSLRVCQSALRMLFTNTFPAFINRIALIFRIRSKEQVCWVYATGCVASVANINSFWNFSPIQVPSYPMGILFINLSVSLTCTSCRPQPAAAVWFRNKAILKSSLNRRML